MTDLPPRLLDAPGAGLADRLLRSAAIDAPRAGSLARALATASTASTTVATASVAVGGLSKTVATWLLVGSVGGGIASGAAYIVSSEAREQRPAPSVAAARQSELGAAPRALPTPVLPPHAVERERMEAATPKPGEPSSLPGASRVVAPVTPRPGSVAKFSAAPPPASGGEAASPTSPAPTREAQGVQGPVEPPGVAEELVLIDAARKSLSGGDPGRTLVFLSEYRQRFPSGHFRPEALAIEIEAHVRRGETSAAQRLGAHFFEMYPTHPLAARVRAKLASR